MIQNEDFKELVCFDDEAAIAALNQKKCHALINAFIWEDTPQGHEYWSKYSILATDPVLLSYSAEAYIRWLLFNYDLRRKQTQ